MRNTSQNRTKKITVRVSEAEFVRLDKDAGKIAVSAHIRNVLFPNSENIKIVQKPKHRSRKNKIGEKEAAQILALLDASDVSDSLAELANACRSGSLIMTPENSEILKQAQSDLWTIKRLLMEFLKVKET